MAGRFERKAYALELFRDGVAPRLLISVDRYEVSRMRQFPIAGMDALLALRDMTPPAERHFFIDVDAAGTRTQRANLPLPGTFGEIAALRSHLAPNPPGRLLIVSTAIHLRRVAYTCGRIFGADAAGFRYCPVPSRFDSLDPDHWWRQSNDRTFVLSEWAKLAGYYLLRRRPPLPAPASRNAGTSSSR
jgi:hypothetical protein